MGDVHVYLKIEAIDDYSPVEPMPKAPPPIKYRRDCFRNDGHEDGTIPPSEVDARRLRAVVYRRYTDATYLVPVQDKLVNADINEPIASHRVPGTVIYVHPGDKLHLHVLNDDLQAHSLHMHGLQYGIDSDGAWPLGVQLPDGRRSDEICPGESWTYIYDVTEEMVGCWPFHDHAQMAGAAIDRGLFGGLVVLPKGMEPPPPTEVDFDITDYLRPVRKVCCDRLVRVDALPAIARPLHHDLLEWLDEWALGQLARPQDECDVLHIPIFLHHMEDPDGGEPLFDSGDLHENGAGVFTHTFADAGSFDYFCQIHPNMQGTVVVDAGATPGNKSVSIVAGAFQPSTTQVQPGASVTWTNNDVEHHTVTATEGAGIPSHTLNGRSFVGNTPTIECRPGQRLRWYVFNLDLGTLFHNFHLHAMRWVFGGYNVDVQTISPAESFEVETVAPEVVDLDRVPDALRTRIEKLQKKPTKGSRPVTFKGEFPFHCHVHHHMMAGMIGLVRVKQTLQLTSELQSALQESLGVEVDDGRNTCPDVDADRCKKHGEGEWVDVPGDPGVTMMHAALVPQTDKVLFFGYDTSLPSPDEYSRTWDASTGAYAATANQLADITPGGYTQWSLWSSSHAFLEDGQLVVNGGYRSDLKKAYRFDPATLQWSTTGRTDHNRFYATTLTLADGSLMTLYGSGSKSHELHDPTTGVWSGPVAWPSALDHHRYYPWTWQLPDGSLFIAGPHDPTHRVDPANPNAYTAFSTIAGERSTSGEKGSAVLLPLRPPDYRPRVVIMGGNPAAAEKTAEIIDLADATPAWSSLPDLNEARSQQFTATLLPDGRIMIAGGITNGADGGPAELLDPDDLASGWERGPVMSRPRTYHSSLILLPDGSVLAGGDPKGAGNVPNAHERYLPGYMSRPRPTIANAPASVSWGDTFTVESPEASTLAEVVLMRPGAVTHGFNMSQRAVECVITGGGATDIQVEAPPDGNIAPPGWYLLFVLTGNRVPSEGRWIQLTS